MPSFSSVTHALAFTAFDPIRYAISIHASLKGFPSCYYIREEKRREQEGEKENYGNEGVIPTEAKTKPTPSQWINAFYLSLLLMPSPTV